MNKEIAKHEGKMLMDYIKSSEVSKEQICKKLNMSMPMLSYYCRKEILSGRLKAKLSTIGIDIFEDDCLCDQFNHEYVNELEEEIKLLNQIIATQKQFITHITVNCRHGNCLNFILDKNHN